MLNNRFILKVAVVELVMTNNFNNMRHLLSDFLDEIIPLQVSHPVKKIDFLQNKEERMDRE